jgi:hypothetical protein
MASKGSQREGGLRCACTVPVGKRQFSRSHSACDRREDYGIILGRPGVSSEVARRRALCARRKGGREPCGGHGYVVELSTQSLVPTGPARESQS